MVLPRLILQCYAYSNTFWHGKPKAFLYGWGNSG